MKTWSNNCGHSTSSHRLATNQDKITTLICIQCPRTNPGKAINTTQQDIQLTLVILRRFPQFSRFPLEIQLLVCNFAIQSKNRLHLRCLGNVKGGASLWDAWKEMAVLFTCSALYYEPQFRRTFYTTNTFASAFGLLRVYNIPSVVRDRAMITRFSLDTGPNTLQHCKQIALYLPDLKYLELYSAGTLWQPPPGLGNALAFCCLPSSFPNLIEVCARLSCGSAKGGNLRLPLHVTFLFEQCNQRLKERQRLTMHE